MSRTHKMEGKERQIPDAGWLHANQNNLLGLWEDWLLTQLQADLILQIRIGRRWSDMLTP